MIRCSTSSATGVHTPVAYQIALLSSAGRLTGRARVSESCRVCGACPPREVAASTDLQVLPKVNVTVWDDEQSTSRKATQTDWIEAVSAAVSSVTCAECDATVSPVHAAESLDQHGRVLCGRHTARAMRGVA